MAQPPRPITAITTPLQELLCRDFQRSYCQRGDLCRFHHVARSDEGSQLRHWMSLGIGVVTFCRDFQSGTGGGCLRGAACKFYHGSSDEQCKMLAKLDPSTAAQVQRHNDPLAAACVDFALGTCTRGPLCRFSHDASHFHSPSPRGGKSCIPLPSSLVERSKRENKRLANHGRNEEVPHARGFSPSASSPSNTPRTWHFVTLFCQMHSEFFQAVTTNTTRERK